MMIIIAFPYPGFDSRQDYSISDTTTGHGSPVIRSARPRARTTHRWAIRRAVAWVRHMPSPKEKTVDRIFFYIDISVQKSSRSSPRILVIRYVVGANSTLMALARGFGVSRATRRAYRLICERKRVACTFLLFIFLRDSSKSGNKNNYSNRLVRRLAERSDVVLENFKPGSTYSSALPFTNPVVDLTISSRVST